MCIFAETVKKVSKTKIVTYVTKDKKVMTIYQNQVKTDPKIKSNAMILPVPCGKNSTISLYNMEKYTDIFKDVEDFFPVSKSVRRRRGDDDLIDLCPDEELTLEVFKIGGYSVSVAYTPYDIPRMDKSVFTISRQTVAAIQEHYSFGFAFVLCVFGSENIEPHPIAYTGDIYTSNADTMFVPTLHVHGDDDSMSVADWDHTIYVFGASEGGIPGITGKGTNVDAQKLTKSRMIRMLSEINIPPPTCSGSDIYLYKDVAHGNLKNQDTFFKIKV